MSDATYAVVVSTDDKPLVWLHGEVKTPPFSQRARLLCGYLLRQLQQGTNIGMPESRPMPSIGTSCHELRISDAGIQWRLVYRVDTDAIVIADVFSKKTQKTPKKHLDTCRARLAQYDATIGAKR